MPVPEIHPVTFKYTCGHEAYGFTNAGGPVKYMGRRCDICSGRFRKLMKDHTDRLNKTRTL